LRATHLAQGIDPDGAGDAVAVIESDAGQTGHGRAVFVPGRLPCGECAICRRGLGAACPSARPGLSREHASGVELPERYLTPLDEPAVAALDPMTIIGAGLVAEALDATARSGLGPGETAIWIGRAPWTLVGAAFTSRRGCRTFLLGDDAAVAVGEGVTRLESGAGSACWLAAISEAEAAATAGPHAGRPERRIYVYGRDTALARAALELSVSGATLSFRLGAPAALTGLEAAPVLRVLIGGGYHPDLVPEALAALARGQIDVSGALRVVNEREADAAIETFQSGHDRRVPILRY
jgi:6-hydroxycyclohex-1-ene-1-carbonyl-CoA dehydrogenase